MLEVRTTPNLYGITLAGDYEDLNALYDSISRYLSFYEMNVGDIFPYHEGEYLLALNYDIRHAYMGTRNVEVKENNADDVGVIAGMMFEIPPEAERFFENTRKDFAKGNLYFSVEILYPLVFHYLVVWSEILDDELPEAWFGKEHSEDPRMKDYDVIDMQRDAAQIRMFLSLVWDNLKSLFGKEKAQALYNYREWAEFMLPPSIYCNAFTHCQMAHFHKMNREEKLDFLLGGIYEIMDSTELMEYPNDFDDCKRHYADAVKRFDAKAGESSVRIFPFREEFYRLLDEVYDPKKPMYHDEFDAFLVENYGVDEIEEPEW